MKKIDPDIKALLSFAEGGKLSRLKEYYFTTANVKLLEILPTGEIIIRKAFNTELELIDEIVFIGGPVKPELKGVFLNDWKVRNIYPFRSFEEARKAFDQYKATGKLPAKDRGLFEEYKLWYL